MESRQIHSHQIFLLITVAFAISISGCGEAGYPVVPVSGIVTDTSGKPLSNVAVVFHPVSDSEIPYPGPTAGAYTDATGKYELKEHINHELGAIPGNYVVKIWPGVDDADDASDEVIEYDQPIPAKYNDESTLKFEVPAEGTDAADFTIDLNAK